MSEAELKRRIDRMSPPRFGNRKVSKMYSQINELRRLIASEGTPAIQAAWDKIEEHIDFAYQMVGQSERETRG